MSDDPISKSGRPPLLVIFDLDDTLCDHHSSLRMRLRVAFEAASRGQSGIDVDSLVEEAAARSVGGTAHFAELLERHGLAEQSEVAIEQYLSDRYRGLELYDDSIDIVMHVRQHARVGMITNGPSRIQRDKITKLAIAELFEFILVSEEEGVWKPDPVIFERALDLTGVEAQDAVYIGDSPEHDIAGARAAGIHSIWINRRGREWPGGPPPDHVIANLFELPSLLGMAGTWTELKST